MAYFINQYLMWQFCLKKKKVIVKNNQVYGMLQQHKGVHLNADHFLWDVHHGIGQPALQAFGKVTDGLS